MKKYLWLILIPILTVFVWRTILNWVSNPSTKSEHFAEKKFKRLMIYKKSDIIQLGQLKGPIKEVVVYNNLNTEWQSKKKLQRFNKAGNLIKEVDFLNTKIWNYSIFEYDKFENLIKRVDFDVRDGDYDKIVWSARYSGNSSLSLWNEDANYEKIVYDKSGMECSRIFYGRFRDGEYWKTYKGDKLIFEKSSGLPATPDEAISYSYNSNGDLIQETVENCFHTKGCTRVTRYINKYQAGLLVSVRGETEYAGYEVDKSTFTTEYEFDSYGNWVYRKHIDEESRVKPTVFRRKFIYYE